MTSGIGRTPRTIALEIFCASFLILFQELALIRWMPGQVRVLAYFPNLILISAFLGLGWNLLGAVVGGLMEFASMLTGFRNLLLFAMAIYLCILPFRRKAQSATSYVDPPEQVPFESLQEASSL